MPAEDYNATVYCVPARNVHKEQMPWASTVPSYVVGYSTGLNLLHIPFLRADPYAQIVLPHQRESHETPADLLTNEQVMDILLADAHLGRRAATCVLPGVTIDGRTYFRRSDLLAWRERQGSVRQSAGS